MSDIEFQTIEQYNAWKSEILANTDQRVIDAYMLELEIKRTEDELKGLKERRDLLLREVGPYKNPLFSVQNMKLKARKLDMSWIRANMPNLLDYAEPSDKYLLGAVTKKFGRETVLQWAKEDDPEGYQDALFLSVKTFDEKTGDSSKKRKFAGQAYHDEWVPTDELCVSYTAMAPRLPSFNPYPCHDDEGDDDE